MPKYIVEQFELHSVQYEVNAASLGEAIDEIFNGDGKFIDNSDELIHVDTSRGLSLTQLTANDITSLKEFEIIDDDSCMLQSIASVKIVE